MGRFWFSEAKIAPWQMESTANVVLRQGMVDVFPRAARQSTALQGRPLWPSATRMAPQPAWHHNPNGQTTTRMAPSATRMA